MTSDASGTALLEQSIYVPFSRIHQVHLFPSHRPHTRYCQYLNMIRHRCFMVFRPLNMIIHRCFVVFRPLNMIIHRCFMVFRPLNCSEHRCFMWFRPLYCSVHPCAEQFNPLNCVEQASRNEISTHQQRFRLEPTIFHHQK